MSKQRQIFSDFITRCASDHERLLALFDLYHSLLLNSNSYINLISRQTDESDIWTVHFYDSLLPIEAGISFDQKIVLDFGTGGGLPGIPLNIVFPQSSFYLLDSRKKKIKEVQNFIESMNLANCHTISERLEETKLDLLRRNYGMRELFDVIVCRSVKIDHPLMSKMLSLLNTKGYILLYKGREIKELELPFKTEVVYSTQKEWGERNLIKIRKI